MSRSVLTPDTNPMTLVVVSNRQRDRRIDSRRLRTLVLAVLRETGRSAELGVNLVPAGEMARLNRRFLQHEGSTDILTFDHGSTATHLHGELFISVTDAVQQAREFQTTWTAEVARYVIHGVLHLCGHDDVKPAARRLMKREENRWVRRLEKVLPSALLEAAPRRADRRHG